MSISEVCIRRPVFTWVLVAIPVVLGLVSYGRLGVDQFPDVDFPVCSVTTVLPGASVEEVESSVTKPLEDIINTISGIDELRSTTLEGVSVVTVQFQLSKNGDVGTQEVRDKINTILAQLPERTETPIVDKFDTDATPVMTIAVSGRRDFREVTEIARRQIKERLETVDGVGAINLVGGRTRAMNVEVDTEKLAGYGLSIEDVRTALVRQNVEAPGGRVDQGSRELVVRTLGRLNTEAEFNALIVANRGGYPIRVRDIGRAYDGVEEPRTTARLDGANAVSLTVRKQSGRNTVLMADTVRARLAEIARTLPADIKTEIIKDQSRFIKKSIEEVQFHLLLAAGLVSATILLFIRDWRTTLIATMAIPTSIIPTFMFMELMGYTLDNITMLGLILAIGIVIDDAVVVHENIFRHMEEHGLDAMEASRVGTREIALPVLATSLSLMVIFVPIGFMGGIVGRFFSSFGLTVAFAIGMSLFVSFTLTPMLCSRFLKLEAAHDGPPKSKSGLIYRVMDRGYAWLLRRSLSPAGIVGVVLITGLVIASPVAMVAMGLVGLSLIPRDDQSEYEVQITTPEGYTLARTEALAREMEGRLRRLPETRNLFTTIGELSGGRTAKGQGDVTRAAVYVRMRDLVERQEEAYGKGPSAFALSLWDQVRGAHAYVTQDDVQAKARELLKEYPDLRTSVNDVSSFQGGRRSQTFQVNLGGPELDRLAEYSDQLLVRLREWGGLTDLDTSLSLRKPEVRVNIDREVASDLGIPVATIADTLNVLVGGLPVSNFRDASEQYDVWLRAAAGNRASMDNLYELTIPSPTAGLVQLTSVSRLTEAQGPTEIERLSRQRIVTVLGNPAPGTPLNDAASRATAILNGSDGEEGLLPRNSPYTYVLSGQAKTLAETGYFMVVALVLSIVFMYLILAAQFESWMQPVAILMALPVTIPFALISLALFRTPMDLYAMFGLFMLIGIVKKNGILQVDATNTLRARGLPRREAILEANATRLRPILMTTVMLVAAMVPIALGTGPGAGARASMAKVIIGGQMLSLILALIVTPVFYVILDALSNFTRRIGFRFSTATAPAAPESAPARDDPARAPEKEPDPAGSFA